ncbi:uncharacterized protein LOC131940665 isoform X2 [Physella acuta]|nr:uncharacterized protein LOC131940665 isoform X2 [Physella acuta]
MALNDNKAGMEGLDKEKINQIIYEASKGSKFFENEQKKEEQLNQRIKEQQTAVINLSEASLLHGTEEADLLLKILEEQQDLSRTIVHVDMDAFYAAVEMRDNPNLRDKPMAVGGMGMLSTSNYIARRYGVRAAMPGFIGLKLCPSLILVKPDFKKYTAVSQEIREIFAQYDPNFSPMSLDEAYLDLTEHLNQRILSSSINRTFILRNENNYNTKSSVCSCDLNTVLRPLLMASKDLLSDTASVTEIYEFLNSLDDATTCSVCQRMFPPYSVKTYGISTEDAVLEMRNRIEQRTHLTASAGIAPNTMLAKVCSDKNKPNGQFRIIPDKKEIELFIRDLPIRKISGIGKVTEKLLGSLGVVTCSDLYEKRNVLYHLFSQTSFHYFMRIALGMGSTVVERDEGRKSMSTEQTFSEINDLNELMDKCRELCTVLAKDLENESLVGKTVTLKIKLVNFEVKTRSHTLPHHTSDERVIFNAAKLLLQTEREALLPDLLRLRLMGIRMSKLMSSRTHTTSIAEMFIRQQKDTSERFPRETNPEIDLFTVSDLASQTIKDEGCIVLEDHDNDFQQHVNCSNVANSENLSSRLKRKKPATGNSLVDGNKQGDILKFMVKCGKSHTDVKKRQEFHDESKTDDVLIVDQPTCSYLDTSSVSTNGQNDNSIKNLLEHVSVKPSVKPLSGVVEESSGTVCCPLCGKQKQNWPLDELNKHIDLCLSRNTIKEILHDQKQPSFSTSSKAPKRSSTNLTQKDLKRQKTQMSVTSFFKT